MSELPGLAIAGVFRLNPLTPESRPRILARQQGNPTTPLRSGDRFPYEGKSWRVVRVDQGGSVFIAEDTGELIAPSDTARPTG